MVFDVEAGHPRKMEQIIDQTTNIPSRADHMLKILLAVIIERLGIILKNGLAESRNTAQRRT